MDVSIRKYEPKDRAQIRRIFNDTAFFGEPIEAYFDDRDFFADFFTLYYTDYEPESVFVAEDTNTRQVVGYLTGCVDTVRMQRIFYPRVSFRLFSGLFRKTVLFNKKSVSYLLRLIKSGLKGENYQEKLIQNDIFPASLHMNISHDYRGKNIGSRLIDAFFEHLRSKKINGVHLGVFSVNDGAIHFYQKHGFYEFTRSRSSLYDSFFPNRSIYLIFMVKHLV